jgi:hypothetical protein
MLWLSKWVDALDESFHVSVIQLSTLNPQPSAPRGRFLGDFAALMVELACGGRLGTGGSEQVLHLGCAGGGGFIGCPAARGLRDSSEIPAPDRGRPRILRPDRPVGLTAQLATLESIPFGTAGKNGKR